MDSEPDEDLEVHFNCGRRSVRIYRSRLEKVRQICCPQLPSVLGESNQVNFADALVHLYSHVITAILAAKQDNGSDYSDLSKKNFFDVIIKELALIAPLYAEDTRAWSEARSAYWKQKLIIETKYLRREREGVDLDELKARIETMPRSTVYEKMKYFLMRVYLEVPVRDDLQLCKTDRWATRFNVPGNAFWWQTADDGTQGYRIFIRKSKNLRSGDGREYKLSLELSEELRRWIETLPDNHFTLHDGFAPKHQGRLPFTKYQPFGSTKNSRRIGQILDELGLRKGRASINLIRRAVADKAKKGSAEDVAAAALASLHSVATARNAYESNVDVSA